MLLKTSKLRFILRGTINEQLDASLKTLRQVLAAIIDLQLPNIRTI